MIGLLILCAAVFTGIGIYHLSCALIDVPTARTSKTMMRAKKQTGTGEEKLFDVYVSKLAVGLSHFVKLDPVKKNRLQTTDVYKRQVPIIPAFCFLEAVMGFLFGGLLLLIAAMVSNNGIGGGDIKLAALLGILYGPYGVLFILTAASLSALAFQALERFFYYRKLTSLPFAPFLFLGSIMAVSLQCRF